MVASSNDLEIAVGTRPLRADSWQELNQVLSLQVEARMREARGFAVPRVVGDYHWSVSPPPPQPEDATLLMAAAASGDKSAADRLLPLVYEQLRQAAQLGLAGERAGHTISATALVHEAYLKLAGPREVAWASRGHFYAAAAEAMRRILIDYARARGRLKRGAIPVPLEGASALLSMADLVSDAHSDQIVMLDDAVRRLEAEDPDVAQVVRLRFYAGLSGDETASALGKSPATVDRDWSWARAWLFRQLRPAGS